jgi:alpha-glucosidase
MHPADRERSRPWWRTAVVYEVYLRSFADSDGDGVGDVNGLRSRLPYLVDLGVDALWVTPWYPSPMADGGYDISDHRDIDPRLGTLADVDALLTEAHDTGLRLIVDLVANHTSAEHPWFRAAVAGGRGAPERARYFFREGRDGGDRPPNDWISAFGGPAWTRVREPDGRPGQWYLHLFAPEQPDLDWDDPVVQEEFDGIVRFWLDRGVDGIRVDAAPALAKVPGLPDAGHAPGALFESARWVDNPHWDRDEVHEVFRRWRAISDGYDGDRVFVSEAVVAGPDRLARYVRPDELHTSFNFDYLRASWDAGGLRAAIDGTLAALAPVGAPPTWVLSSHDETRHVTRFGRASSGAATMGFDASGPCSGSGAREPPRCSRSHCPAAPTSTRGRSSACPRSRTCPRRCCRTRPGSVRATPPAAGTAAGCRCRGPVTGRRSASPPTASARGCPSRRRGGR